MMRFFKTRAARSRRIRASAAPATALVAAAPSASAPVSENSRACAAAVAELVESLDFIFEQLDLEGEPGDLLRLHLERLALEAGRYDNARIQDETVPPWSCTPDTAQVVFAACQCSSYIYKLDPSDDFHPVPVMSRTPSVTGTEKAACIWKMESAGTLIVSVRGTASVADHMVNFNSTPKDARRMFDLGLDAAYVNAHSGFLTCAATLRPVICDDLARAVRADGTVSRVVFTGHSAGGAVSALLFLHMISTAPPERKHVTFGLATFGSPPVLSINVTDAACQFPNADFAYAFVNEHDLVARADPSYLKSVIALYRKRYEAPSDGPAPAAGVPETSPRGPWPLPAPTYHPVGDVVVLRSSLAVSPGDAARGVDAEPLEASRSVQAMLVPAQGFSQALFCEVGVHKRRLYLERIRSLLCAGDRGGKAAAAERKTTSLWSDSSTLQADEGPWPN